MIRVPNPIGKYVLIERSENKQVGLVSIPEKYKKHVKNTAIVLGIGHKCSSVLRLGDIVSFDSQAEGKEKWVHPEKKSIEIILESDIFAITRGKVCIPVGRTVLMQRFVNRMKYGSFYIPDRAVTQNLFGSFTCLGMSDKPFRTKGIEKLRFGDVIKLSKWHETHREIMLGGQYCLIVKEEYVELQCNELFQDQNRQMGLRGTANNVGAN